jgi:hypothetical protein
MSSKLNWLLLMVVAVVTFIVMSTHVIGRLIDRKIGDIRVNIPKIRVQAPNVLIRMNPAINQKVDQRVNQKAVDDSEGKKSKQKTKRLNESFLSVDFADAAVEGDSSNNELDELVSANRAIIIDSSTPPTEPRIAIGCTKDSDCNVVNGGGQNVCKIDGTCSCVAGGSGLFCHYGPVNYRDPKDMSQSERTRFKSKYRNNMTLQDYKNWLMLYKENPAELNEEHRKNLMTLIRGGQVTTKDIPAVRVRAPTNAADYFQRMYKNANISVNFPDNDGPYVGSNYGQYDSFVPPDNQSGSNAITGIVNVYQEGKDDARAVDWYMRPPVTVGEDEQRPGDIYKSFVADRHNQRDLADIRASLYGSSDGSYNPNTMIPREISLQTFEVDLL